MAHPPRSKKTDTIEVRVSPELKSALGRFSETRGQSMSETIRDLVGRALDHPADPIGQTGVSTMARLARSPIARFGLLSASVLGLAAAYTLTPQNAAVASVATEARVTFAELDRNGDNVITPDEYAAQILEERTEVGDDLPRVPAGCVGTFIEAEIADEVAEMSAPPEDLAEERLRYLDSDGDGAVSFDELGAFMLAERAREFLEFDDDGNGFVTLDEIERIVAPDRAREAAYLREEGLSEACVDALLAEVMPEDEDFDDPRLLLAEFDVDRDGRVGLMEFLEH